MALPDEEIPGAESSSPSIGGSKDLLYGWLVGRAAADLGLAQALATSEAQRSAQIQRLEESLLGQIHELYERQLAGDGSASLEAIRTELSRVDEQQRQLVADRIEVTQLESAVREQLERFESQIQQRNQAMDGTGSSDFRFELKLLVDRIARAEHAAQQAQNRAAAQQQQIEEIITERITAEFARVKAEIQTLASAATSPETVEAALSKKLDELRAAGVDRTEMVSDLASLTEDVGRLSAKLNQLQATPGPAASLAEQQDRCDRELDARLVELERALFNGPANLGAELSELKTRLDETEKNLAIDESLPVRVGALDAQIASLLDGSARRDAELSALTGHLRLVSDQCSELARSWDGYLERILALEERLTERIEAGKKMADDVNRAQLDVAALLNRMSKVELVTQRAQSAVDSLDQRAQEVTEGLRAEWAALKSALNQGGMVPAQSVLANVEENISAKLAPLQSAIQRAQQETLVRDRQLNEIHGEMQRIGQRLIQVESSAQQTHVRAVHDAAQVAELRDRLLNELSVMENQLGEQQMSRVNLENFARELSVRIDQQQDQLSRANALLEGRGAETVEIKAQQQNLLRNPALASVTKPVPASTPANRSQVPIGVAVGLSAVKAPSDSIVPTLTSTPLESTTLLTSYDAEDDTSSEQKKQLQQRISADIERVRAELRKRAGVSR